MSREGARVRVMSAALALGALAIAWALEPAAAAQPRGASPDARKRQAVEMCARELKDREGGRDARVERTIRSDYKGDRVAWDGYMTVSRSGPDRTLRVACTVAFEGKNRITSFQSSGSGGGGSGGGGDDAASRACWREAERRGADVRDVADSLSAGSRGRLVILRLEARRELLCLYRGSAALYRPV